MKKIFFRLFAGALVFVSCSSTDDSASSENTGFSNNPVSGTVYSSSFSLGGGYARPITLSGVASYYIYLDTADIDCFAATTSPVYMGMPAAIGSYDSADAFLVFKKANGDYESTSEIKIEITAITETTVKGRVRAEGSDASENYVNGTFEVQYCPL
ncbi:hypothetical protein ACLI09_03355 [Flavobacterium sp. RHBU_24]|uniref:hypothetical protein n=1 Tax=Flavobacterium sp. RHBU_24 TaxID=3391185 RepID=UPI0039847AE0